MIIDVHGHYTTSPPQHDEFRRLQLAALASGREPKPATPDITDDEIAASIVDNQLRLMDERGIDVTLISPKASAMGHHVDDQGAAVAWARASNDLVHRVVELFPDRFAAVCQLPQTPSGSWSAVVAELRRCVEELGFVGCNLNPDPSGGHWTGPPLTDDAWTPLYDAMTELDVPAMVHVSTACASSTHTLGAHYLNADTTVFMQLLEGDMFERSPGLRFVIPHGGGAVPYHWGRYRGLAERMGLPDPSALIGHVVFDTCVYHQPGIDLLTRVVPAEGVLFASEMLGAVRGADPETGIAWDDTLQYVRRAEMTDADRQAVLAGNALRVYPRLRQRLAGRDGG